MSEIRRPLDVRRAVLAELIAADGPVTVRQVADALTSQFGDGGASPKRIADVLRYQMRLGRVRRVGRGVYQAVPGALPRSTAWRCVNWRREQRRWMAETLHLDEESVPPGDHSGGPGLADRGAEGV